MGGRWLAPRAGRERVMFEDDATVNSESNQQPPSDAFDSHAAIDSARTLQDVPKSNPEMGARGATDFAASLSTDASSVMSSPTDPAALTSPAASTPTAASAISGNQDAPITGAAASEMRHRHQQVLAIWVRSDPRPRPRSTRHQLHWDRPLSPTRMFQLHQMALRQPLH
jgi:hypothetical protein